MVGVAGKSKGCAACRKRKIRCGLEKPTCQQCQRSKRECPGYSKPTVFLNRSSRTYGNADVIPEYSQHLDHSHSSAQAKPKRSQQEQPTILLKSVDPEPLTQNIVLADFVNSTLPKGTTRQPPLIWITSILESADCAESLSLAGSALGYGWQGHITAQYDRVAHGRKLYSDSLSLLRKNLVKGQSRFTQTTLATTCALALYELIEFGTYAAAGWLAHTSGIEILTLQASPQAFVGDSTHKIFLFSRIVMILRSLLLRRASFLDRSEWLHGPWTLYPKNSFHQLLDIVLEVVGLLEISDMQHLKWKVEACGGLGPKYLLISIALTVSRLRKWYAISDTRLAQGPLAPTNDQHDTDTSPLEASINRHWYPARQPSNSGVSFDALQKARVMIVYWAIVLTLQIEVFRSPELRGELYHAHTLLDSANSDTRVEEDIRAAISIDLAIQCADNIVRWFEYAGQDLWNSFGPAFGVVALKTAIMWYVLYQQLPRSRTSEQAGRSDHLKNAQNMLSRLVNVGCPRNCSF